MKSAKTILASSAALALLCAASSTVHATNAWVAVGQGLVSLPGGAGVTIYALNPQNPTAQSIVQTILGFSQNEKVYVALADFDNDGLPEVVYGQDFNPNITISHLNSSLIKTITTPAEGTGLFTGPGPFVVQNVTGDSTPEIIVSGVGAYDYATGNLIPSVPITTFSPPISSSGIDFNGEGYLAQFIGGSHVTVSFSGPIAHAPADIFASAAANFMTVSVFASPFPTPEPTSLALLALGIIPLTRRRPS